MSFKEASDLKTSKDRSSSERYVLQGGVRRLVSFELGSGRRYRACKYAGGLAQIKVAWGLSLFRKRGAARRRRHVESEAAFAAERLREARAYYDAYLAPPPPVPPPPIPPPLEIGALVRGSFFVFSARGSERPPFKMRVLLSAPGVFLNVPSRNVGEKREGSPRRPRLGPRRTRGPRARRASR